MSYQELFPREFAACQAGLQSPGGVSGTSNPIRYPGAKFSHIVWSKIGTVFAQLGPDKFNRVELWSAGRKRGDMQAWVLGNKILNELTLMNGMVIPHQDDLTRDGPQQLFKKGHDLFAAQAAPVGSGH